jgi:hypothetical protein
LSLLGTAIGTLRFFCTVGRRHEKKTDTAKKKYCGSAEDSTGSDGNAAVTVAHAVEGGDGEDEVGVDAAASFPHAVAVGAPCVYCHGGERSVYCYGGAEESKGGDRKEEKNGDAAAALPHAVTPVGAHSVHSCGGAEERKGRDFDAAPTLSHAVEPVGAPSAEVAGLLRQVARF